MEAVTNIQKHSYFDYEAEIDAALQSLARLDAEERGIDQSYGRQVGQLTEKYRAAREKATEGRGGKLQEAKRMRLGREKSVRSKHEAGLKALKADFDKARSEEAQQCAYRRASITSGYESQAAELESEHSVKQKKAGDAWESFKKKSETKVRSLVRDFTHQYDRLLEEEVRDYQARFRALKEQLAKVGEDETLATKSIAGQSAARVKFDKTEMDEIKEVSKKLEPQMKSIKPLLQKHTSGQATKRLPPAVSISSISEASEEIEEIYSEIMSTCAALKSLDAKYNDLTLNVLFKGCTFIGAGVVLLIIVVYVLSSLSSN